MVRIKYKKTIKNILSLLCLLMVVSIFFGARAGASVPPDNTKNYLYVKSGDSCANGDFGILGDAAECIRIRSDGKGYALSKPGISASGKPLACGQNALGIGTNGASNSPIFELVSGPFVDAAHHTCLTINDTTYSNDPNSSTPSKYWDIYTYSDRTPVPAGGQGTINTGDYYGTHTCGDPAHKGAVHISIDLGCRHKGNPILDMLFAIIRFLSIGVGLVIIGSLIVAGIQYTTSRGDPQATAKALGRVYSTVGALLLFIFAYAILNWLVPGALLK